MEQDLRSEAALLMIGCLVASDKSGWHVKAASADRLSSEGFSAALAKINPKQHMEDASVRAKRAMAAATTACPKAMLNAAAITVLLLALERKIGHPLPELVGAALSVVLDPTHGSALQDRDIALDQFARAFAMKESFDKPIK